MTSLQYWTRTIALVLLAAVIGIGFWMISTEISTTAASYRMTAEQQKGVTDAITGLNKTITGISDATTGLNQTLATMNDPRHGLNVLVRNIQVLTVQAARTSTTAEIESKVQSAKISQILTDMDKAVNDLDGTVNSVNSTIATLSGTVDNLSKDGHALIESATATMDSAGKLLGDPDNQKTLHNIEAATGSLAETSVHMNLAAANGEKALGYIADDLKPTKQGFWRMLAGDALGPVIDAALHIFVPTKVTVKGTVKTTPANPQQ